MLTVQPGIFFGHAAVRFMRLAGVTDDAIAADLDALESGETTPAQLVARGWGLSTAYGRNWVSLYVAGLCRCAGIDVRGVFGGAQ